MKRILLLFALTSFVQLATAAEGESRATETAAGDQALRRWGSYIAIGNPYPSLVGLNGAYNINEHLRAAVGYGEVEVTTGIEFSANGITQKKMKAQTYSVGVDYLFMDTPLRPVAGGRVGYFNVSGDGEFSLQGISKSTALLYTNLGLDWVAGNGFNLGTGLNVALAGGKGANFYANVGYFF